LRAHIAVTPGGNQNRVLCARDILPAYDMIEEEDATVTWAGGREGFRGGQGKGEGGVSTSYKWVVIHFRWLPLILIHASRRFVLLT